MTDISMCTNALCPKRDLCYRYMAIPDSWQSYMEFQNICHRDNNFQWFYEIGDYPIRSTEEKEEIKVLVEETNSGE